LASAFLGDSRCAAPLRVLAASLPFMAFAACFKGWLIALRKGVVTAAASLLEQTVKTAAIALMLGFVFAGTNDVGAMCLGIAAAITVSESASCTFLFMKCALWRKNRGGPLQSRAANRRELLAVTCPVALSVWTTSLLHTAESLLVPKVFENYSGGDRGYALSQFGMIRGMVIPLLFFPFVFLASLVSVFTPEISRLNLLADREPLKARVKLLLGAAAVFAFAAGGAFFALPEFIGEAFYPGENTARAVKILALVTPFMYIETVCDGLLKAAGEQKRTLGYTVLNSLLRLALIFTLVKRYGGEGYLWLLTVSNLFSYILCRIRLYRVTGAGVDLLRGCLAPVLCAAGGGFAARTVVMRFFAGRSAVLCAATGSAVYTAVFAMLLLLFAGGRVKSAFALFARRGAENAGAG
ncbi:MAG: polysaccharide biosynthesis C-terminal domain-containing protein, partial [Clostridia bacterium]|nr:polysaccharide biosynthesis C-terminal domain-containing protein [Clostridia bacterium]